MELVYLWISKYKNIENQGFNLNSKWQVEYNDQTKELTVLERNPQPIPNFFNRQTNSNIISNVTAIVGENGAGKSSLMDLLILFSTQNKFAIDLIIKVTKAVLILLDDNNVLKIYSTESININNNLSYESFDKYEPKSAIFYSSILEDNNRIFYNIAGINDNSLSFRIQRDGDFFKQLEIMQQVEYINRLGANNDFNSYLHQVFKFPKYLLIQPSFIYHSLEAALKKDIERDINNVYFFTKEERKEKDIKEKIKNNGEKMKLLMLNINNKYSNQGLNHVKANVIIKLLYILRSRIKAEELSHLLDIFEKETPKEIDNFLDNLLQLDIPNINKLISNIKKYFELITTFLTKSKVNGIFIIKPDKLDNSPNELDNSPNELDNSPNELDNSPDKLHDSNLYYCITETIREIDLHIVSIYDTYSSYCNYSIFEFKWLASDKEDDILSFSAGEHLLLNTLAQLFNSQYDKVKFLYIDEGELGLHPNWQAQYLNIILAAFEHYYYDIGHLANKVHIILTTHSPFVLSDLPRENVVFLEKDKAGKCQVVKNPMERPQTFASNIHTLFAEGFFMREGTIGHFAKSKIEKVLTYLSKDFNTIIPEEIRRTIDLIGEPLIKNKLLRMIEDRNTLTVDERINNLQAQIDELKKRK